MNVSTSPLGIGRDLLVDLRDRFGGEALADYFVSLSTLDLCDALLGFDPQTPLGPPLGHDDLLSRLDWFSQRNPRQAGAST